MIDQLATYLKTYPGGRTRFCKKVRITEGRLSQIIGGEKASPELAKAIHKESNGVVPGSLLRPDLWRSPQDVPIEKKTAAA
jgi:hypothetical protein